MDRAVWIGASTKMYLGYSASIDWMTAIAAEFDARRSDLDSSGVRAFVAPAYPVLESAVRILSPAGVLVGAQDVATGDGALTGEVSAGMLAELGVGLVEIGHAERRRLFGDTDTVIAAKTAAALEQRLTPLLCVGEEAVSDAGRAVNAVFEQIRIALGGSFAGGSKLAVAYEPVWAIGAPAPAPIAYIDDVVGRLRARLASEGVAAPIIYGGSAGPGLLSALTEVDGLFLGRFAHDPTAFGRVLDEAVGRGQQASA